MNKVIINHKVVLVSLIAAAFGCSLFFTTATQQTKEALMITITPPQELAVFAGPAQWFTGNTQVEMLFGEQEATRASGATVTFEPRARTAWHTHPRGQTLIVTSGVGYVQMEGHPRQLFKQGEVVWIPPHVKHWHGAAEDQAMSHIAIQESEQGSPVTWLEQVSESEYAK